MIGHLGSRVSALLDGQLPADEAERCWAHVHECHACRDLVEREGWVKTRLAGLSYAGGGQTPAHLLGALRDGDFLTPASFATAPPAARARSGVAFLGGTALGAAVVGVVALGLAPGAPAERRPPVSNLNGPVSTTLNTPVNIPTQPAATAVNPQRVDRGARGVKIEP